MKPLKTGGRRFFLWKVARNLCTYYQMHYIVVLSILQGPVLLDLHVESRVFLLCVSELNNAITGCVMVTERNQICS